MRQIRYQDASTINKTSSKGNQGKYRIDNEWIKTDFLGYEAAAEYLVSELLHHSNITNYVSYTIEKIQVESRTGAFRNTNACISSNFLPSDAEIITLDKFLKQKIGTTFEKEVKGKSIKDAIKHIVNLVEQNSNVKNYGEYLTAMLELDAFTLNEDRHVQNIIFIYKDGEYTPGPIFDNGAAFLSDITQEYSMEEKTNTLIGYVKAKPFSSSFEKQVEACQELYGKQLILEAPDISKEIELIRNYYGERIANRMQHIYDIQLNKCKNLLQIKESTCKEKQNSIENLTDSLYTEEEMLQEIRNHIANGGSIVTKAVPENFVTPLKRVLMEEEVPFVAIRDEHGICNILTKDIDTRNFLKIQKSVFSAYQPPKLEPKANHITCSKANQLLQIDERDDV